MIRYAAHPAGRLVLTLLLFWGVFFTVSGAPPEEKTRILQEPVSARYILIAAGDTRFEGQVIAYLEEALADSGYKTLVSDIDRLPSLRGNPYRAVIVLSGVNRGKLKPEIERFLGGQPNSEEGTKVYISTITGTEWSEFDSRFHAITSASRSAKAAVVGQNILNRLFDAFEPDSPPADSVRNP